MLSYWERNSFFTGIDYCIVGAGIVGLHTALFLKKQYPSKHIVVVERGALPYGASTRNAGFACFGSVSELLEDLKNNSEAEVLNLVEMRWNGLQKLIELHGESALGLEKHGGYELFSPADTVLYEECMGQLTNLNKQLKSVIGVSEVFKESSAKIKEFGFGNTSHLIWNQSEAQLDTGKLMQQLIARVQQAAIPIYFGLPITKLAPKKDGVSIHTADFEIDAKVVAVTTNGFASQLLPELEIQPARAQVLITKPIEKLAIEGTFHYDKGYYYFRNVGDRILFGGGRNMDFEGENTYDIALTSNIQNQLDELLKTTLLPSTNFEIDMRWSGIMGMGAVKSPVISATSIPNVFVAARCNGMGVAIGIQVAADLVQLLLKQAAD